MATPSARISTASSSSATAPIPAQTAYVHIADRFGEPVFFRPGPHTVIGTLQLGNKTESDGRTSYVRLLVEHESSLQAVGPVAVSAR